jgi:peptide/nickel transport system substrate-binding protein
MKNSSQISFRRNRGGKFVVALVCLTVALLSLGTMTQAAERDNLLAAVSSIGNTLDSAIANFTNTTIVTNHIYDRIIALDENFDFAPAVATSWEYTDNVTFKFWVGDGFVFHNDEPLKLEDVVFSIERLREIPRCASFMNNIASVEVTGENEITIRLEEPNSSTIRTLMADAHVFNKAYVEAVGGSYANNPIGTGPYRIERFVPGDRIVLVAWEDYPFAKPAIKNVTFKTLEEDANRYISIETGEAQFADISFHDQERAENNKNIDVVTMRTTNTAFISMNTQKAPFDNKNVRLAMAYATDKASLAIVKGGAAVINSMTPPMFSTYHESENVPTFDLNKAQALLESEGYNASNPLKFETWVYGGNAAVMETYQAYLRMIGVEMTIKNLEFGVFLEGMANGEYQMLSGSWNNTTGDPLSALENYWTGSFGAHNISFFDNERCDELYDVAKVATDLETQVAAAREVQEIAAAEMPIIPTFSNLAIYTMDKGLKGVQMHPSGVYSFRNAYFE